MSNAITGGCQCGAVRFRAVGLGRASLCHCRMCQKAFGGFYGPLVTALDLEWTREAPARFASSNLVRRGFCQKCGTPLSYEYDGGVDVAIGALDDPLLAAPVVQVNPTDRLAFVETLHALPWRAAGESPAAEAFMASVESHQHPDRDTETWPPEGSS